MRIRVKTTGLLGRYLPPGSGRNSAELDVVEGSTPADVMRQLGMPMDENYLVSLNGTVVPRDQRASQILSPDDRLSIMPPLKGG